MFYTDLKPGTYISIDGQPWVVLEYEFVRMQQRKPVVKIKMRNIISGNVSERSFQPSDEIEEAEIEKKKARFLYSHRGEFWFSEIDDSKKRFSLKEEFIGASKDFLKPNLEVSATIFDGKVVGIELPIKADYEVIESPPAIKGNTAQGGAKIVIIETGAKISVPLFINQGDLIRVNTQTRQYTERVEKG